MTLCSSRHTDSTTVGDQPLVLETQLQLCGDMIPAFPKKQGADPSKPMVGSNLVPPAKVGHDDSELSSCICINKRSSSFRCVGLHSSYAWSEGEEHRPLLRGWLHGVLSISVFPVSVAVILAVALDIMPSRWFLMGILLVGNLTSYAASAVLHLVPFQRSETAKRALKVDIMMIPVRIGVCVVPFFQHLDEALATIAVHATFVALTAVAVGRRPPKFDSSKGVITVGGGARTCLIQAQWALVEIQIGIRVGFDSPLWIASLLIYFVAGWCMVFRGTSWRMPWHRPDVYGWHEDFHTFLCLGDLVLVAMAVVHLSS